MAVSFFGFMALLNVAELSFAVPAGRPVEAVLAAAEVLRSGAMTGGCVPW